MATRKLFELQIFISVSTNSIFLDQWFPNFFGSRTTQKNLVVREGQNIDLYRDSRTTTANLVDHQWSAEQTLGITDLDKKIHVCPNKHFYEPF